MPLVGGGMLQVTKRAARAASEKLPSMTDSTQRPKHVTKLLQRQYRSAMDLNFDTFFPKIHIFPGIKVVDTISKSKRLLMLSSYMVKNCFGFASVLFI